MKRHRHTPEQIVRKLREGDRMLNEGKDITEVGRHLEIAESTWNRLMGCDYGTSVVSLGVATLKPMVFTGRRKDLCSPGSRGAVIGARVQAVSARPRTQRPLR
jgi:hypothetical protein